MSWLKDPGIMNKAVCHGLRSQEIIRRQWVRLEEPEIIYEAMGPGLWPEEPGFN